MKKVISAFLIVILLASFVSCGAPAEPVVISPKEYPALNDAHLSDLLTGMILSQSWQTASELDPDLFVYYYIAASYENEAVREGWTEGFIPGSELEGFVTSRFDVTADYLHTSEYYNAEKNAYEIGGIGSNGESVIRSATIAGDQLSVKYDIIGFMDYVEARGTLVAEVSGGDVMDSDVRFLSNELEWSAQHELRFPSAMDEVDYRGIFMMDSSGYSGTSEDGVNYTYYDGADLNSIIGFYEDEALPALLAEGHADPSIHEDGWYWSGTYRGGTPLTIDVRRKLGADSYIITILHEASADPDLAARNRERDFMQPPSPNDFSAMREYVGLPFYAGLLDTTWENGAASNEGAAMVAYYALGRNHEEGEEPATSFPAAELEPYLLERFGVDAETMRYSNASYDDETQTYPYTPIERSETLEITSATSYGSENEDGEPVPFHIMISYAIHPSAEDPAVLWTGELTVQLADTGYEYISNIIRMEGVLGADEWPKNTPENQANVDRYIMPFMTTGFFSSSFSSGQMEELLVTEPSPPLKSIFNAFYNVDYPNAELRLSDEDTEVPGDIFEGTLMNHLDLTPEEIRTACAAFYDPETAVYTASFGLGGGSGVYFITDSSLDGNVLTLAYDVYVPDYDDISDYEYIMPRFGTLRIDTAGGGYRYLSNEVQNASWVR